uniref:Uncharacterized protein n=1 Tax=Romanomermis culicivorax TaxID=13658 RepID=A0A915IXH9_ROMCU
MLPYDTGFDAQFSPGGKRFVVDKSQINFIVRQDAKIIVETSCLSIVDLDRTASIPEYCSRNLDHSTNMYLNI